MIVLQQTRVYQHTCNRLVIVQFPQVPYLEPICTFQMDAIKGQTCSKHVCREATL